MTVDTTCASRGHLVDEGVYLYLCVLPYNQKQQIGKWISACQAEIKTFGKRKTVISQQWGTRYVFLSRTASDMLKLSFPISKPLKWFIIEYTLGPQNHEKWKFLHPPYMGYNP